MKQLGITGDMQNTAGLATNAASSEYKRTIDIPRRKLRALLDALILSGITFAIMKFMGVVVLFAAVMSVSVPVAWVVVGIIVFTALLIYKQRNIRRTIRINNEIKRLNQMASERLNPNISKLISQIDPYSPDYITKASKEAKRYITDLYKKRRDSLGVDIEKIETIKSQKKDGNSMIQASIHENMGFLTVFYQLINTGVMRAYLSARNEDTQKILHEFSLKVEYSHGTARLKSGAKPFENVPFKYKDYLAKNTKNRMFYIKAQLGMTPFNVDQFINNLQQKNISLQDVLHLAVLAVNTTLVSQAVLQGAVHEQLLKQDGNPHFNKACKLKRILSADFQDGQRSTALIQLFYNSPGFSAERYQELFWMLNTASGRRLQPLIKSPEGLLSDSPHEMVKIIDGFSHDIDIDDALNLAQIGSKIAQSPKIAPQALRLNTESHATAVSAQNVRPPMATQKHDLDTSNRALPSESLNPRTPRPKNRF